MISFKPRSIFQLTITGFLLVSGILVTTLLVSNRQMSTLNDHSQSIISQSATAMQASRTLIEQAVAMERNALQYRAAKNPDILAVYIDRRKKFETAAQTLSSLALTGEIRMQLSALVLREALAYDTLEQHAEPGNEYPNLMEVTYRISELVNEWTRLQLLDMEQKTTDTQHLLRYQGVLMISTALLLAGVFTALITRPLLQIEKAISQLGSGNYTNAILVKGPRDLINLGAHLDWLRNRLGKLEEQRSSFLRHVSHELKSPLAAMQESAALLNDGIVGHLNEEQMEIIRIQSKSCQRLQVLIDDLLHFNSGSFSVLNAMPQLIRLEKVIEQVIAAHELEIRQDNLVIASNLEKATIKGNPEQIRVIIDNLFTNAMKFSPPGGRIKISLTQQDGAMVMDMEDQGPGIPEADRDKVFDAFYQGTLPEKNFHNGSGLGLAIAREYSRMNGGSISIKDSDQGAHFQIRFPLVNPEPE